jgi:hypothetical protein
MEFLGCLEVPKHLRRNDQVTNDLTPYRTVRDLGDDPESRTPQSTESAADGPVPFSRDNETTRIRLLTLPSVYRR